MQFSVSRYASNFSVNTTGDDQGVRDGEAGGPRGFGLDRDNRILDLTFKTDLDYYASPNHTVRAGAQVTRYDASYRQGFSDSIRSGINTVSRYETGYLEYTLSAGGLEITPGLRLSHFQLGDYTNLSPRVSARYRVNDSVSLKGGWGIYHQYINLISVEGFSYTTDMWLPVDETLTPGRAVHNAAGITFRPGDGWETDIEFYHKNLSNLVEFQSRVRLSPGASLSNLFLQGTGSAYGGELLLRKNGRPHHRVDRLYPGLCAPDLPRTERRQRISAQVRSTARCLPGLEPYLRPGLELQFQLGIRHGPGLHHPRFPVYGHPAQRSNHLLHPRIRKERLPAACIPPHGPGNYQRFSHRRRDRRPARPQRLSTYTTGATSGIARSTPPKRLWSSRTCSSSLFFPASDLNSSCEAKTHGTEILLHSNRACYVPVSARTRMRQQSHGFPGRIPAHPCISKGF